MFKSIIEKLGQPYIDLFATRLNNQLSKFVSWRPDPDAFHVDAFTLNWHSYSFYAFPPFSVLGKTLQKVALDLATGIVIASVWTTQPWFAQILHMLISKPILLPVKDTLLQLPGSTQLHPLCKKLRMMACLVSGNRLSSNTFLEQQPTLSWHPGETVRKNSTDHTH